MKYLLIMLIAFVSNCNEPHPQSNLDDTTYYWEFKNKNSAYSSKSIIEFKNDSIYIIDYPLVPAGFLTLQVGKYSLPNSKNIVECQIEKSISISLNTGMVGFYRENCNSEIILELEQNRIIRRDTLKYHMTNVEISKGPIPGFPDKIYSIDDDKEKSTTHRKFYRFKKYKNANKLKECKEYTIQNGVRGINVEEDTLYVINHNGGKLYKEPDLNSEVLDTITIANRIIPINLIKPIQNIILSDNLKLAGSFIRIKHRDAYAYIFSSDLTNIKPEIIGDFDNSFRINLSGMLLDSTQVKIDRVINGQSFEAIETVMEYENFHYTKTYFDGCFEHKYDFINLAFNEVYHHMISNNLFSMETKDGNITHLPKLIEEKANTMYFSSEGATEALKIENMWNLFYRVSSYDCD